MPFTKAQLIKYLGGPALLRVAPTFPWKGHWHDTRTMVIDATERLASSTRYEVALAGPLAAKTNQFKLEFVHELCNQRSLR